MNVNNSTIDWLTQAIKTPNQDFAEQAKQRQNQLTKPAGALGRLEEIAIQLAALLESAQPLIKNPQIVIFAADHGVACENVSNYPQSVTLEMINNFLSGGAAISVLAQQVGATLSVVNAGTIADKEDLNQKQTLATANTQYYQQKIANGSQNFCQQAAMSEQQLYQGLNLGRWHIQNMQQQSVDLFIGGEMGIGNTSAATAILCKLLNLNAAMVCGPGTGLDHAGLQHKIACIDKALSLHTAIVNTPLNTLRYFGGFEIVALTGAYISCGQLGIPVLVDGFICSVAALLAIKLKPALKDWLIFSHQSHEPGHQVILQHLNCKPLLQLNMRLGEASGAATALPLLKIACAIHNNMATFEQASISTAKQE